MSEALMHCTDDDPRTLLGAFLRRRTHSAKDLARKIDCDPRAADGYRAGRYWPQARHWPALVAAFGRDLTEAVFFPDAAAARLQREVHELEQVLAERRKALRDTARFASRMAEIRDGHPSRSRPLGPDQ